MYTCSKNGINLFSIKEKMKNNLILLLVLIAFMSCNDSKKRHADQLNFKKEISDTVADSSKTSTDLITVERLQKKYPFKNLLHTLDGVKHTGNKHSDELSNSSRNFLNTIFDLRSIDLSVKTTSYTYKKDCVFYLHTIKCVNDSLSIKPFLENAQGKKTEGYLGIRVLIFAMLNNKEANFIDIPANWNHIELKEELLALLYERIDSDVIECYRAKKCEYKDLRKTN